MVIRLCFVLIGLMFFAGPFLINCTVGWSIFWTMLAGICFAGAWMYEEPRDLWEESGWDDRRF